MLLSDNADLTWSKLRFYSVGIVAQNKTLGSKDIQVTPTEETPFIDGEVTATPSENTATGTDASGATYTASANSSLAIQATWLQFSASNRITAPDVRRGEKVMIFQYADADKYYWTEMLDGQKLRRLETVIYSFSASRTEDDPVSPNTQYFLEVNTHKKHITLHTCKADGEPFGYDIQLDTKNGKLLITDDTGNYIHLDSSDRRIELYNTDGSHYDMRQDNLTVTIPNTTKFITKAFVVQASDTCDISATNTFKVATMSSNIAASDSAQMSSPNTNVIGSSNLQMSGNNASMVGSDVLMAGGSSAIVTSPATVIS